MKHFYISVNTEVRSVEVSKHYVEILNQSWLRLGIIILGFFIKSLSDNHHHVQFLFDFNASIWLEWVEKFYQNRLAKDQHWYI